MTPDELAAIEARAAAATAGEWTVADDHPTHAAFYVRAGVDELAVIYQAGSAEVNRANAELMAHARSDVPSLCQALRESRRDYRLADESAHRHALEIDRLRAELATEREAREKLALWWEGGVGKHAAALEEADELRATLAKSLANRITEKAEAAQKERELEQHLALLAAAARRFLQVHELGEENGGPTEDHLRAALRGTP